MSIVATKVVFAAVAPLTASEKLVLLVLADFADENGGRCFPSQATIATRACATTRGIRKMLHRLEQRGLVSVLEPARPRRSTRYRLNLAALEGPREEPGSSLGGGERRSPQRGTRAPSERNPKPLREERRSPDPLLDPLLDPSLIHHERDQIARTDRALTARTPDDFAMFWQAYPKKTGKAAALKAWKKAKPPIAQVLDALGWQTRSIQWNRDDGRYRPNPATYLNQGRWQDEPEDPAQHVGEKSRTGDTVNAARAYLQDSLRHASTHGAEDYEHTKRERAKAMTRERLRRGRP